MKTYALATPALPFASCVELTIAQSPERIANALVMFRDRYVYPKTSIPSRKGP